MTIEEQRRAIVLKQSWPVRCRWPRPRGCSVCSERSVWHLKRRFLADGPAGVFMSIAGERPRGVSTSGSGRRGRRRVDRANDGHLVEAGVVGEPGDGPAHPARDPGWPKRDPRGSIVFVQATASALEGCRPALGRFTPPRPSASSGSPRSRRADPRRRPGRDARSVAGARGGRGRVHARARRPARAAGIDPRAGSRRQRARQAH